MFTVEFEKDYSVVTSMDEQNNFDDVEMYEEDIVLYIGIFQIIVTKIYEK